MKHTAEIINKDTTLFTTVYPNPAKESIIFLHGGPGLPEGLTFVEEYLAPWFQVISFHQRGTLLSPTRSGNFSMQSYLSDIEATAGHFGLETFHLLGHSWGGLYAQIYAQNHPRRLQSLFLISPGSGTGLQWAKTQAEIARYTLARSTPPEVAAMAIQASLGALSSDKGYQNLYKMLIAAFNSGFTGSQPTPFRLDCVQAKAINRTTQAILLHPLLADMEQPPFPITITYGDEDIYGDSKTYVLNRYPTADVHFIPHSGHLSWSHQEQEFKSVLNQHYKLR